MYTPQVSESPKENRKGEGFRPSLVSANEAAVRHARPEILAARAKVMADESQIYETLAKELLEESIAQRMLADRHGISLPADAGANAIEKIKTKYFSKMDQFQMVDSFKSITSRISERRQKDPEYVGSQQYRMDTYWLKGLLQRMQDTRYIDDPQGEAEQQILSTIGASGLDVGEYAGHITDYHNSDRGRAARGRGSVESFDLDGILGNGLRLEKFKEILPRIGLTAEMLNSVLSPSNIRDLMVGIDNNLTAHDLAPVGISADELKSFVGGLSRASADVINKLKSIVPYIN